MVNWMHWLNHSLEIEERRLSRIECKSGGKYSEGSLKMKLGENIRKRVKMRSQG